MLFIFSFLTELLCLYCHYITNIIFVNTFYLYFKNYLILFVRKKKEEDLIPLKIIWTVQLSKLIPHSLLQSLSFPLHHKIG